MYVKIENGSVVKYPYSDSDLRKDNPNTSFPKNLTDAIRTEWNVLPVTVMPGSDYDKSTHKEVKDNVPTLINGVWTIGRTIIPLDAGETEQYRLEQVRKYELEVQKHMDEKVAERGYDSMLSAATYATSKNGRYGFEGKACVDWRDAVWDACYAILADVEAGNRTPPTVEELLAELPAMEWPVI